VLIAASFVVLLATGLVLFVAPLGRIANWTAWNVLGLRKTDWAGLHITFSALFLVVTVFHLVFNWRPLVSYFKDRLTRRPGFRPEWALAVLIVGGVFAGTRLAVPPFSTVLAWNEDLKQSWDAPANRAPIPHAELLTLRELAAKGGVPVETAAARLEARGLKGFAPETVVQEIAAAANLSAQQVYAIILGSGERGGGRGEGRSGQGAGGGPGRKTLEEFCAEEGLALSEALARLAARGITANSSQTLREIAVAAGYSRPYEILDIHRGGGAQP
jgi:hypothetical protein